MEILLAGLVAAAVAGAIALASQRPRRLRKAAAATGAPSDAAPQPHASPSPVEESNPRTESRIQAEARSEADLAQREQAVLELEQRTEQKLSELEQRQTSVADRERELDDALKTRRAELVRIAKLSQSQARQMLLNDLQAEVRHHSARVVRQVEEQAKADADRRSRSILAACMQRIAAGHTVETTVSVVSLESDDLKGRIIGREGRNIRALETLTGIDIIIDDTPSAVVLSGFDGVRREIARLTLEKLLADGRIHPARIEEAYYQARSEIDNRIVEVGEQAALEASVGMMHAEIVKLLGRLHYRTSFSQNVLAHSIECSHLAAMVASELGANPKTARRAALLHDIGKAVTHEVEGPHALVGGRVARRYNESEAVCHAMEAHHNEVEPQTVEAVIVQIVDAVSGARPGARGESLEQYLRRLSDLERIATRHQGVDRVYAMQAGREVRVIVQPEEIDDASADILSHRIAREVESELDYPGQIKVTVIRESRAVDYAN